MQAVYTWIPGLGNKTPTPFPHEHDEMACSKSRPTLNFSPVPGLLKRNRSGTIESLSSMPSSQKQLTLSSPATPPPPKRQKLDNLDHHEDQAAPAAQEQAVAASNAPPATAMSAQNAACSSSGQDVSISSSGSLPVHSHPSTAPQSTDSNSYQSSSSTTMTDQQRLRLKDNIKSYFDLQILLKHKELRLIEQEQAKAQVMLEQLRRCRQIPFPGQPGSTMPNHRLLDGNAPALVPKNGHSRPPLPAPWSVTDGPYTRHYARWLVDDPLFDSEVVSGQRQSLGRRSSVSFEAKLRSSDAVSSHRRQHHSTGDKIQAMHLDQPQQTPKDKPALSIQVMKRPDGQWVKLHCPMCHMEMYRSVQGFLNHYRIQHKSEIKSHAEAAIRFGIPVDGPNAVSIPTIAESTISASVHKSHGQVHSLNTPWAARPQPAFNAESSTSQIPQRPSMDELIQNSSLNPHFQKQREATPDVQDVMVSSDLPKLSALAQRTAAKIDLRDLYAKATNKVNLDMIQPLILDDEVEEDVPLPRGSEWRKPSAGVQGGSSSTLASREPAPGMRTLSKPPNIQVPPNNHVVPDSASSSFDTIWSLSPQMLSGHSALSPYSLAANQDTHMTELSPHTNPGLVTDHEDDDEMEDEARSVAENAVSVQGQVRIYSEHGDQEMADVPGETKSPLPPWGHTQQMASEQALHFDQVQENQKKRRGRPLRKGKKKMQKETGGC